MKSVGNKVSRSAPLTVRTNGIGRKNRLVRHFRQSRSLLQHKDTQAADTTFLKSVHFDEKPVILGKTNISITSPLGIGTWAWGDAPVWGYKTYDKTYNDDTIEDSFREAVQSNINFFDTAESYGWGKSESFLGEFIEDYNSENENNPNKLNMIVASKFLPLPWKLSEKSFQKSLKASIDRIGRPIDLYQIHGLAFSLRSVETWAEAMAHAYEQGLIKAVGVSNYNADQLKRTHEILSKYNIPLASNQIGFSLLRNNPMTNGLLETCKELGVSVLAYSPLGMGALTGKYNTGNPPKGMRPMKIKMEDLEVLVQKIRTIGEKYGKTPVQVAVNWCICKGTIPLCGVKNKKQVQENVASLGWRLTPEDVHELDNLSLSQPKYFWAD